MLRGFSFITAFSGILACCVSVSIASRASADTAVLPTPIHSPLSSPYNIFGGEVAMATQTLCAIGVRGADGDASNPVSNQGAVDCFELTSDGWTFEERLQPSGLAAGDQFGECIVADAQWLAASGTRHDASGVDSGAVWLFQRVGGAWQFHQKLIPGMSSAGARFGSALALSNGQLAIGSPTGGAAGSVTIYALSGLTWQLAQTITNPTPTVGDRFGDSLSLSDAHLLIGDPLDDSTAPDRGAVFAYTRSGSSWQFEEALVSLSTSDRQYFGRSLALHNARVAIGANGADAADNTSASGLVEVHEFVGGSWQRVAELRPETAAMGGHFGWDVALEGDAIVVGEPGYGLKARSGPIGRARVFSRHASGQWLAVASILAVEPVANDIFGTALALADGRLVIASPGRLGQQGAVMTLALGIDCDGDKVDDWLQIALDATLDCNGDLVLDACQADSDGDGEPNACECPADLNGDGFVNSSDLAAFLGQWGSYGEVTADMTGDLLVDAGDISILLSQWGVCQ